MIDDRKDVNIDYYLELLKKEKNLVKENRSLLTENRKESDFLMEVSSLLEKQINYDRRSQYYTLILDYLKKNPLKDISNRVSRNSKR